MGKFGGNAIFGPKMSIFDHFRGGGRSSNLVRYKPFGQVNHNIIGTQKNKKIIDHLGEPGGLGDLRQG